MEIRKSSRHARIAGDFGEALVLYWLSKYGFECAAVDHTGIDLIARNPHSGEVMGISVKSRTRTDGAGDDVNIPNDHFDKVARACAAFKCVPYFAIVVDKNDMIRGYLLTLSKLLQLSPKRKLTAAWKMSSKDIELYAKEPDVFLFEFTTKTKRWWG